MTEESITPISASFTIKVQRLFRAGGATVAMGLAGLALIVIYGPRSSDSTSLLHGAGCLLVAVCLSLMLVASRRAKQAAQSLQEDLPILDDLQRAALRVTEIADVTQTFAFKHLMRAQGAFTSITAIVEKVPFIGAAVKRRTTNMSEVSSRLATATMEANNRIRLLQTALRTADLAGIREYGRQVDAALAQLRKTLDAETDAPQQAS